MMAKHPSARSDEEVPLPEPIAKFVELVPILIGAASDYAAKTEADPAAEGNIRRLKVLTASLMGALNTIRPAQMI